MKHDRVISYRSRKLKKHEYNYLTHDLELSIIIFTLKLWCHYLYGSTCEIYMNHKNLKYILDQKDLNF